jgi:hypothetical protein
LHQPYHVSLTFRIQDLHFKLKTLLDTGSDLNLLNKNVIPVAYWQKTSLNVSGLGNVLTNISHCVPKATLCLEIFCMDIKFYLAEIPSACILGTPFLCSVSPHGSTQITPTQAGYFITVQEKDCQASFHLYS